MNRKRLQIPIRKSAQKFLTIFYGIFLYRIITIIQFLLLQFCIGLKEQFKAAIQRIQVFQFEVKANFSIRKPFDHFNDVRENAAKA